MKVEGVLLDVRTATDLNKNELRQAQVQNLAAAPGTPVLGQIYFDTALVDLFVCTNPTGPVWERVLSGTVAAGQYAAGSIVNADINATAAIAYSKLNLANSIVNADVAAAAAIAYSKLNLATSIVNADIAAAAAIAYSKLALTNSVVNADIAAAAAIAYSKLNLTGNIVNADIGAAAAIAYTKLNLTGSIVNADISGAAAIAFAKLASPLGSFSFNAQLLTNLADPVSAQDAATKNYVDGVATGLDFHLSARLATTGAESFTVAGGAVTTITGLTGGAAPVIDGVTVAVNDRLLIKDAPAATGAGSANSNQPGNGIYRISALGTGQVTVVRAVDMDTSAETSPGAFLFIEEGTANSDVAFVLTTNAPITLNTTTLAFAQYSRAESLTFRNGLVKTGTTVDVNVGVGLTSDATNVRLTVPVVVSSGGTGLITIPANGVMIGAGTAAVATATGTADQVLRVPGGGGTPAFGSIALNQAAAVTGTLGLGNGGTGGTTAPTARQNLGATGFYSSATHGAGTTISIAQATHGLTAGQPLHVQVIEVATGDVVYPDMNVSGAGAVTITFAASVGANSHRVTLVGQS